MIITDLVILICLILSAFFSGMEIAFVSANRIYLEIEKQQSGFNAKFLNFITKNPSRFIATMLVGNNISLVIYGIFMGDRILQLFFPETLLGGAISIQIVFIQTIISTIIILLTAEFLPKVFFSTILQCFDEASCLSHCFFLCFVLPDYFHDYHVVGLYFDEVF